MWFVPSWCPCKAGAKHHTSKGSDLPVRGPLEVGELKSNRTDGHLCQNNMTHTDTFIRTHTHCSNFQRSASHLCSFKFLRNHKRLKQKFFAMISVDWKVRGERGGASPPGDPKILVRLVVHWDRAPGKCIVDSAAFAAAWGYTCVKVDNLNKLKANEGIKYNLLRILI